MTSGRVDDPTATGPLTWVPEENPTWDAGKRRVIGGAPEGAFVLPFSEDESLPGEWWSARDGDRVVGYGRLDVTWGGDAEILLAVDPQGQRRGVGSYVLARLEEEASQRGINYVRNRIREHEQRELVYDWLVARGYRGSASGDLRKRVGSGSGRTAPGSSVPRGDPGPSQDGSTGHRPRDGESAGDLGPGHEEQGGYVDVDEHQY